MKTAVIIGGASGIGNACVNLFREYDKQQKWRVYATYYSSENIDIENTSVDWTFLDITDKFLLEKFVEKVPKIDALIICASKNKTESLESFDIRDAGVIFDTNVIGQINALSLLKGKLNKNSSVVLFSSITGKIGSKRRIVYSASRSAMYGLVKSLAAELAPYSRVNAIVPGYIETEQYIKNSTISNGERKKTILLARLGRPEEVAKLAWFLASEDSSYINAQCINIDGGVKNTSW